MDCQTSQQDDLATKMSDSREGEYEGRILEIADALGRDIGVNIHPKRVVWRGKLVANPNFMTGLGSDQCEFDGGKVILPKPLKDRLTPEEWKPLLASQLFYERRSKTAIFLRWILTVLVILTWIPVLGFLGVSLGDYGLGVGVAILIPFIVLSTWFFSHELRGVRLKADERAARLIGPSDFLGVLEKVNSYRIDDIKKREKMGFRTKIQSHFPSIDDRIRRVKKLVDN